MIAADTLDLLAAGRRPPPPIPAYNLARVGDAAPCSVAIDIDGVRHVTTFAEGEMLKILERPGAREAWRAAWAAARGWGKSETYRRMIKRRRGRAIAAPWAAG
jgi:hypothetical protein